MYNLWFPKDKLNLNLEYDTKRKGSHKNRKNSRQPSLLSPVVGAPRRHRMTCPLVFRFFFTSLSISSLFLNISRNFGVWILLIYRSWVVSLLDFWKFRWYCFGSVLFVYFVLACASSFYPICCLFLDREVENLRRFSVCPLGFCFNNGLSDGVLMVRSCVDGVVVCCEQSRSNTFEKRRFLVFVASISMLWALLLAFE